MTPRSVFSRRPSDRRPGWRLSRTGLALALVGFMVFSGTTVAYGLWTSQATVKSTPKAASLAVTTTNFDSVAQTFANHRLSGTGSFTVTNTTATPSAQTGAFTATLGYAAGGDAALASALGVTIWPVGSTALCTPSAAVGSDSILGTWGSALAVSGSLAAGASASYCVRSAADERGTLASVAGSMSIIPTVTASLTIGTWTETAQATAAPAQSTEFIYPHFSPLALTWYEVRNVQTGSCLDVSGDVVDAHTPVIDYGCKAGSNFNQQWKFTPSNGNYYDITPRNAPANRIDVVDGSVGSGAAVDVQVDADARMTQEWQLQDQNTGMFQIVNRLSGLCLQPLNTPVSANIEYAQVACNGTDLQRFTLVLKETEEPPPVVPVINSLSCADYGVGAARRVTLAWSPVAPASYTVQTRPGTSGNWTIVATAPNGASNVDVSPTGSNAPLGWVDGNYPVRVVVGNSVAASTAALATTSVWKGTGSAGTYLKCAEPVAAIAQLNCQDTGTTGTTRKIAINWQPEATHLYSVQSRVGGSGNWTQLGTVDAGVSTYAITAGAPLGYADGTFNLRVVKGISTAASTQALATSTAWKGTGSAGAYLRCVKPVAQITTFTCANDSNTGNARRVTLNWSPEATESYVIEGRPVGSTGGWTSLANPIGAGVSSFTITTVPSTWAEGEYTVRVTAGSQLADTTVWKAAPANSPSSYLRCAKPVAQISTFDCVNDANTGNTRRVTLNWSPEATETYAIEGRLVGSAGGWTSLSNQIIAGATSFTVATVPSTWAEGEYTVRVRAGSVDLANRTIWKGSAANSSQSYLRCAKPVPLTLQCTEGGWYQSLIYTLNGPAAQTYRFQSRPTDSGTTWTTLATVNQGETTATISGSPPLNWTTGTRTLRIVDANNVVHAETTFTVATFFVKILTC